MKRIGEAVRIAQGNVVVRSPDEDFPAVGTSVLTEDLAEVGDVVEIFGPVEQPYCSISPNEDVNPASLLGSPLYAQ